jgi:TonB family protein
VIKRCPTCNRTYSDETISFCLADGSLLSAPYPASQKEPPPTEILLPPTRAVPPPTRPAEPAVPTITSLPEPRVFSTSADVTYRNNSALTWILFSLAAALLLTGVVLVIRYVLREPNESANTTVQSPVAANNTPSPVASHEANTSEIRSPPSASPATQSTPLAKKESDKAPAQPGVSPAGEGGNDYNRIFTAEEVTSRPRVLEKPEPTYTDDARKNQISGTVVVRALFSATGQVTNVVAVSGLPDGLTERAIAAAKSIRFVPATKDGHPVSMWLELQYNFNLY